MARSPLVIAVHGGAGSRATSAQQRRCLSMALENGYRVLAEGGAALDAVERAIRVLEASGLFNAGAGSRLQLDGVRRMDASIMEGRSLRAGAVAAIEGILHPVTAARLVMEKTDHVLLVGPCATRFAKHCGLERLRRAMPTRRDRIPKSSAARRGKTAALYSTMTRGMRSGTERCGTVGAVALDGQRIVAAGASTGGIAIMLPGRVGDTPLIGSGVYADQAGAVAMTGLGESIIRIAVAKDIVDRVTTGQSAAAATRVVLAKLVARTHGAAGALTLTASGRLAIQHTTPRMAAGYWDGRGTPIVADRFF